MGNLLAVQTQYNTMEELKTATGLSDPFVLFDSEVSDLSEREIDAKIKGRNRVMVVLAAENHFFGLYTSKQMDVKNMKFLWTLSNDKASFFFHVLPNGKLISKNKDFDLNINPIQNRLSFGFGSSTFELKMDGEGNIGPEIGYMSSEYQITSTIGRLIFLQWR
ncbi:hypothetical protein EIN_387510 [Entamoeba invadens IP1]|uniref:Uncharacterized protein n=1 Tax=Entamoeba invadens IP1 TaxID=370355 RepID=A0A0A1UAG0_ENTIV|nr:hypothetical protein EIN_387510 [Entamoeba invadens IP1]ELP92007.1 hypothetical protein EIN_387510 [Entamoeba invadens IP1]|eukprot:XP_004258778.1 hypothetical protein EIN_387510 [Entamoeba invadens IP1]